MRQSIVKAMNHFERGHGTAREKERWNYLSYFAVSMCLINSENKRGHGQVGDETSDLSLSFLSFTLYITSMPS